MSRKSLDAVGMPAQRENWRVTAIYSGNYHAQPFVLCFHFETPKILRNFFLTKNGYQIVLALIKNGYQTF